MLQVFCELPLAEASYKQKYFIRQDTFGGNSLQTDFTVCSLMLKAQPQSSKI